MVLCRVSSLHDGNAGPGHHPRHFQHVCFYRSCGDQRLCPCGQQGGPRFYRGQLKISHFGHNRIGFCAAGHRHALHDHRPSEYALCRRGAGPECGAVSPPDLDHADALCGRFRHQICAISPAPVAARRPLFGALSFERCSLQPGSKGLYHCLIQDLFHHFRQRILSAEQYPLPAHDPGRFGYAFRFFLCHRPAGSKTASGLFHSSPTRLYLSGPGAGDSLGDRGSLLPPGRPCPDENLPLPLCRRDKLSDRGEEGEPLK